MKKVVLVICLISLISITGLLHAEVQKSLMIDDFEGYSSNEELRAVYVKHHAGSDVAVELDDSYKSDGKYGMRYHYDIGNANWVGIAKKGTFNFEGYNAVSLWMKNNKSDKELMVRFREVDSREIWDAKVTIEAEYEGEVVIPFGEFSHPVWSNSGDGILDADKIVEVAIHMEELPEETGQVYIDDLKVIFDDEITNDTAKAEVFASIEAPEANSKVWYEEEGYLIIEAESVQKKGAFWRERDAFDGYTGKGYLQYIGKNEYWDFHIDYNQINDPNKILTYYINIENPGQYIFKVRNRHFEPEDNDVWVSMDNSVWVKCFDEDVEQYTWNEEPKGYYLEKGYHKLQLAGRSTWFMIDRIVLHQADLSEEIWSDVEKPESNSSLIK